MGPFLFCVLISWFRTQRLLHHLEVRKPFNTKVFFCLYTLWKCFLCGLSFLLYYLRKKSQGNTSRIWLNLIPDTRAEPKEQGKFPISQGPPTSIYSILPPTLILWCIFITVQFNIFSNLLCNFFLMHGLFRSMLFTFQIFGIFFRSRTVIDF